MLSNSCKFCKLRQHSVYFVKILSLLVSRWTNSLIGLFDLISQVFKTFFEVFHQIRYHFLALFEIEFSSMAFITFSERLIKREAATLKFSTPVAMIATRELIMERYYAILDQLERAHFYNHLVSNYTKQLYY